jgi:SAM-dependent methyltransferase
LNPTVLRYIDLLRCPLTGAPLTVLPADELAAINAELAAHARLHRDGTAAQSPLADALGTGDRGHIYRVGEDILWLLPDLALVPAAAVAPASLESEKRVVQSFYDDYGWVKTSGGLFHDTAQFTDARPIAREYRMACNARIGRHLAGGSTLLDVASGAIPHPEYLEFSREYAVRICVDFSIRALGEARAKLGGRGLYILGDITRLPLAADRIDAVISLHTIYHVPQGEQTRAVEELWRVCRPGGRVLVVYTWAKAPAMDWVFGVRGFLGWLKRGFRRSPWATAAAAQDGPALYFRPQDQGWYRREVAARFPARLRVWSAVSTTFQNRFVPETRRGRATLGLVKLVENALPGLAGRYGQYPLFILDKPAA